MYQFLLEQWAAVTLFGTPQIVDFDERHCSSDPTAPGKGKEALAVAGPGALSAPHNGSQL